MFEGRFGHKLTKDMRNLLKRKLHEIEMEYLPGEVEERRIKRLKLDVHVLKDEVIGERKSKKFSIKKDRQIRQRSSMAESLNNVSKAKKSQEGGKITLESIFV